MKSIIQEEKWCYVCKTPLNLHKHHIFYGRGLRLLSEKDGCWVWLCAKHHNMSDKGVHFNSALDHKIKRIAELEWIARNGKEDDFIKRYGRSYLYD